MNSNLEVNINKINVSWPWIKTNEVNAYSKDVRWPRISIVTPTFNQANFLEKTILSILNQGYPNLEYIIIDGGSSDETVDIIRKYESRISYWVSEPDKGQSDAINKGLKVCSGDIFNWINSDDFLEPGALEKVAREFLRGYDVVCGRSRVILYPEMEEQQEAGTIPLSSVEKTIGWVKCHQPATFFNFHLLKALLPLSEKLHYTMDQELWIKFLLKYGQEKIKTFPTIIVNFLVHRNSKTGTDLNHNYLGLPYLFFKDYHSIFCSMARSLEDHRILKILKKMFGKEEDYDEHYHLDIDLADKSLIYSTLNYYLLRLSLDEYYKRKISTTYFLLSAIDRSVLHPKDKAAHDVLRKKVFLLPAIAAIEGLAAIFRRAGKVQSKSKHKNVPSL
jgi:glycosyltransferase involved in cell wall biosynthesis